MAAPKNELYDFIDATNGFFSPAEVFNMLPSGMPKDLRAHITANIDIAMIEKAKLAIALKMIKDLLYIKNSLLTDNNILVLIDLAKLIQQPLPISTMSEKECTENFIGNVVLLCLNKCPDLNPKSKSELETKYASELFLSSQNKSKTCVIL